MSIEGLKKLISTSATSDAEWQIGEKILEGNRLKAEDGLFLFEHSSPVFVGALANFARQQKHGKKAFFNRNFHIEPTNICIYNCSFCSYRRVEGQEGSWEMSLDEIRQQVELQKPKGATEVHITGGVHPKHDIHYYGNIIREIKKVNPEIHVKAYSAVEIFYMAKQQNISFDECIKVLKEYGLDSIPGGGAEIFDEEIRKQICADKASSDDWLAIHRAAHENGLESNATMLYGHIETYAQRIDHLEKLRQLQDKTQGFNAFIPLKFKNKNNKLSNLQEVNTIEDLKMYAISRLYLDNFPHLKAYWPMLGIENARLALSYGADDVDGTIDDSTKIYTMAGADKKNALTSQELIIFIRQSGFIPVERDSLYNEIRTNF